MSTGGAGSAAAPDPPERIMRSGVWPDFMLWKSRRMSEASSLQVRFEPVGVEMDVEEGETVLDAAFRQGISLMHGCKEGQCGSCKSLLVDGDIELLKYSTFALPDYERDTDHILLCRTHRLQRPRRLNC